MGWRDSYDALCELFPQVDRRLIKGAALEHGDDIGAAAEFILNEVIDPDEENPSHEQQPERTHYESSNSFPVVDFREGRAEDSISFPVVDLREGRAEGSNSVPVVDLREGLDEEEHAVAASDSGIVHLTVNDFLAARELNSSSELSPETTHDGSNNSFSVVEALKGREEAAQVTAASDSGLVDSAEDELKELLASCSDSERRRLLLHIAMDQECRQFERFESQDTDAAAVESTRTEPVDRVIPYYDVDVSSCNTLPEFVELVKLMRNMEKTSEGDKCEAGPRDPSCSIAVSNEDNVPRALIDLIRDDNLPEFSTQISGPSSEVEGGEELGFGFDQSPFQGQEARNFLDDKVEEELAMTFAGYRLPRDELNLMDDEFPIYDGSISIPRSAFDEDNAVALDDGSDSMLSIQKSAISEEMDRADWEDINCTSITQLNHMEPLDNLVEEAKADKEALRISIEEIRDLRVMADRAEYDARQSREAAVRGGADVMAKVAEMRKILCRARETNAAHAGEVFGERAVLVSEAKELKRRLAQVDSEKATAVAALNELKASLQARVQSAILEKEAAEQERVEKEQFAKEALVKEEELVAKVAQESRDLEAEAENCSKIRDFLNERASIVDALQGEVAVLREDAEALKKDLESMSLSYSSSAYHMPQLSQAGSEIYNTFLAGAAKTDIYREPSDLLVHVEEGANSGGSNFEASSPRSSGVQISTGDKKAWSSLPSLLSGMSGSQDLSGSGHSGYSSTASNSLSSFRESLTVNKGERSQVPSGANVEVKDVSTPNSPESPAGTQEERELLKAKLAMFPGEELEMEYSSNHNLDVFRTEKPGGSDDDDWQILEKGSSASSSPSSVRQ